MKSKFRRIVHFLRGESKNATEEMSDFLDSAVDELILNNALARPKALPLPDFLVLDYLIEK